MHVLIEAANATVAIAGGSIVEPSGHFEARIKIPNAEIRPGLINGHDHLHRNHYGRLGAPPYANACDWARDIQRRFAREIADGRKTSHSQALRIGAWKNLLSGVTHVVHHDPWDPVFEDNFPLHVVRIPNRDSLGMSADRDWLATAARSERFALHVAEGVDQSAAEDVRTLWSHSVLSPGFLAVHAVGADSNGVQLLRSSDCVIVWCPSSNEFLFGRSAPETLIAEGSDIILGTDSLLTGAGDLLDELRIARGRIPDLRLIDAVGATAARRLGLCEPSLEAGAPADIIALYRPLLEATRADVAMVMVGGEIRVLDPGLLPAVGFSHGRILTSRGVQRWISS